MNNLVTYLAAILNPGDIGFQGPQTDAGLVQTVLMPVYFWAGVCAVIVIIVAGFFYVTSHGDPSLISRAKQAITGAIIGLVVILLAFTITSIVTGVFA